MIKKTTIEIRNGNDAGQVNDNKYCFENKHKATKDRAIIVYNYNYMSRIIIFIITILTLICF